MRKTRAAPEVVACVCDAAVPWPTCQSLAGMHTDDTLGPMVKRAAGQVALVRRQLAEQAIAAAAAADYGTEARAWDDVWRMRRKLQQTCKAASDFQKLIGNRGPKNGCERATRAGAVQPCAMLHGSGSDCTAAAASPHPALCAPAAHCRLGARLRFSDTSGASPFGETEARGLRPMCAHARSCAVLLF